MDELQTYVAPQHILSPIQEASTIEQKSEIEDDNPNNSAINRGNSVIIRQKQNESSSSSSLEDVRGEDFDSDEKDENSMESQPELTHIHHSHSSILDEINDQRLSYQIRMEEKETEEKFEKERIKHGIYVITTSNRIHYKRITQMDLERSKTLNRQIHRQQNHNFESLYKIFEENATKTNKEAMDMDGFIKALKHFGIEIGKDLSLQQLVFAEFDLDNDKQIDYNDFSSTLSMIVASKQEKKMELLFRMFDMDKDGYLEIEDFASMLLTQNHIAVVTTGAQEQQKVRYNERHCKIQSKKMIASLNGDDEKLDDSRISFEQFKQLMKDKTEKDMMIEHIGLPSMSLDFEAPKISEIIDAQQPH